MTKETRSEEDPRASKRPVVDERDSIVLSGKTTGKRLTLKRTVDEKGVAFYEGVLDEIV